MTLARLILALIVVSVLPAQPPNKPATSQGTVHFYRPKLEIGTVIGTTITCDNLPIVRLFNGTVYTLKMSAGRHAVAISGSQPGINLDVVADKDHYVRIDYPVNSAFAGGFFPVIVPAEQGRMETAKLKKLDPRFIESATCGS